MMKRSPEQLPLLAKKLKQSRTHYQILSRHAMQVRNEDPLDHFVGVNKKVFMKDQNEIVANGRTRGKHNAYQREHCRKNRDKTAARLRRWQRKRSAFVASLKNGKSCIKCGESHPACLDFHHREGTQKVALIQRLARSTSSNNIALLKEIEKCDLICSNCHRKIHWKK